MKFSNQDIYSIAKELFFLDNLDIKIPVRIGFYLKKNASLFQEAAREIEEVRISLCERFGEYNPETNYYTVPVEKTEELNRELNELLSLEQELPIHIFKIEDFDGLELSLQQISVLMPMIEE